jgi:hypothetical protein
MCTKYYAGNDWARVQERKNEPFTESPNSQRTKKARREEQSEEHIHNFLSPQGNCSQRIRPARPVSQFRVLL